MTAEIRHFGILGMKWGRHKASTPSQSKKKSRKAVSRKKIDAVVNKSKTRSMASISAHRKRRAKQRVDDAIMDLEGIAFKTAMYQFLY